MVAVLHFDGHLNDKCGCKQELSSVPQRTLTDHKPQAGDTPESSFRRQAVDSG